MNDQNIVRFDGTGKMVRDEAGYFVKHSDYAKAQATISRLTAERDAAILERDTTNTDLSDRIMDLHKELDLTKQLVKDLLEAVEHRCGTAELDDVLRHVRMAARAREQNDLIDEIEATIADTDADGARG